MSIDNGNNMKKIIKHAYTTVPFYIKLVEKYSIDIDEVIEKEEYSRLPIITKKMIQNDNDALLSAHCILDYINGNLYKTSTSGSCGQKINIYWKKSDFNLSMMPLWIHRKKKYDISPNDKMLFFYTYHPYDKMNSGYVHFKNQWGFSKNNLDLQKMKDIIQKINEIEPVWFQGQPSMIKMMIQTMKVYDLKPINSLRYIELTGEFISTDEKKYIEKFLNCVVCNQYGCNEANSIALQEENKTFRIFEENVNVEIVKDKVVQPINTKGDIIITTLNNYATPFIRYNIGDQGIMREVNGKNEIELINGRSEEWIKCNDGTTINSYSLKYVIDAVNRKCIDEIIQYQIEQESYDKIVVNLVIDNKENQKYIEDLFYKNIEDERLKRFSFSFVYHDYLMQDDTGKLGFFKRKI